MPGFNEPLLINIVGHAAGALIFAIFLGLLFSGRGWSGARGRNLSGLAAGLSLIWNLGSLMVLIFPGWPVPALSLVIAISFSVLSLLPAVLLHLWLEDGRRPLVFSGYVLSLVAVGMHFWEIRGNGAALHQAALLLITIGFLGLTGIAVAGVAFRRIAPGRAGGGRMAASMSLALFATSFVHFGSGHAGQVWSSELFIHHAGIPLALFVLLQDYRFVLLDAFVRFLANALLAAVLTWAMIQAAIRLQLVEWGAHTPLVEAMMLIGVCGFLVFFAWLRNRVQGWLTQAVFGRGLISQAAAQLKSPPAFATDEEYLDWATALLGDAVKAETRAIARQDSVDGAFALHAPVLASMLPSLKDSPQWAHAEAIVPIRLMQGDSRVILLGRRRGGQRYLRDDLDSLSNAAAEIVRHVESLRRQEMSRLVAQAELRALQSQINPHFLFNALNTVYGTIPRESPTARRMVLNLAEIFRYFLQSDKVFVPLSHEMQIVRAYLEIEQSRLGARLTVHVEIDPAANHQPIPVLSIQPLVENAIKHGLSQRTEPGFVRIHAECREDELRIAVTNSSAGVSRGQGTGVGLLNVRRRLEICYGHSSSLDLDVGADVTIATLRIPVQPSGAEGKRAGRLTARGF
jgi:two-component system LytT family sensor kinase